jgi:hypothetical protein
LSYREEALTYVADPYTEELPAPLVREWQMMKESIERAKKRDSVPKDPPSSEKITPAEKGKNKVYYQI